ncbi:MAG: ankyrin repeat domain-containing protein [Alphaproteobacteria bacterium]
MKKLNKFYQNYQSQRINTIEKEINTLNQKFVELNNKILKTLNQNYNNIDPILKNDLNIISEHISKSVSKDNESTLGFLKKLFVGAISEAENNFINDVCDMSKIDNNLREIIALNKKKDNLIEAFSKISYFAGGNILISNLKHVINDANTDKESFSFLEYYNNFDRHNNLAEKIKNNNLVYEAKEIINLHKFFDSISSTIDHSLIGYVIENDLTMARICLDLGANPVGITHEKQAIEFSVQNNNVDMTNLLFNYGAKIPTRYNNQSEDLLHIACRNNNLELTKLLISKGADVNELIRPKLGWGEWAYESFVRPIKKLFVEVPELTGTSPLHIAAKEGNTEIVETLIKSGAKTNITDIKGHTYKDYISNKISAADYAVDEIISKPTYTLESYWKAEHNPTPNTHSNLNWLKYNYANDIYEEEPVSTVETIYINLEKVKTESSSNSKFNHMNNYVPSAPSMEEEYYNDLPPYNPDYIAEPSAPPMDDYQYMS